MNDYDKKRCYFSFKKKQLHRKTVNEMTYIDKLENIAEKALPLLLALVVFPLLKHKQKS